MPTFYFHVEITIRTLTWKFKRVHKIYGGFQEKFLQLHSGVINRSFQLNSEDDWI